MQLAFVLAKDYQGGGSSPRGSQWSFCSVDVEFCLFDLQQKTLKDMIFSMCFYLGPVFGVFFSLFTQVVLSFSMLPQHEIQPLSRFFHCSKLV